MKFSLDNKRILSACYDSTIRIWSAIDYSLLNSIDGKFIYTFELLHTMTEKGRPGWIMSVDFSSDGQLILAGSADSTI